MKVLFIGDIVGSPGREAVSVFLPKIIEADKPDVVIANAENAAGGKGITKSVADELFGLGIHVLTMGNHTFDRKEAGESFENENIVRPGNYPEGVPGRANRIINLKNNEKLAVINLMGRVYMPLTDCPFRAADKILETVCLETRNIVVDFHAEVTSEKQAMGLYLDGKVSAVIGTHTHVQTADDYIMSGGTAYITDAGMTGPCEGVIGMDKELVLKKFLTGIPQHFAVAKGKIEMRGCLLEIDKIGKAVSFRRFARGC